MLKIDPSSDDILTNREESDLGVWTQLDWRPRGLAGLVESISLFDGSLNRQRERHYPTGELDLILQLDGGCEPFRLIDGQRATAFPSASLSGLIVSPVVVEAPALRSRVVAVRLRPAGAFALFGIPLHELTGTTVNLHDAIGPEARRLAELLDEAGSDKARVEAMGRWIADRLARHPGTDPRVNAAVREIEHAGGDMPIARLHAAVDLSPKRFTRLFEEQVGVKPKLFSRIVRFRRLAAALRTGSEPFNQAALTHGYYDQSHMNAEFNAFAGMSPSQFRAATPFPDSASLAD